MRKSPAFSLPSHSVTDSLEEVDESSGAFIPKMVTHPEPRVQRDSDNFICQRVDARSRHNLRSFVARRPIQQGQSPKFTPVSYVPCPDETMRIP